MLRPSQVKILVSTAGGLQELLSQPELDFLEFKREINRRDPAWKDELRADCAALATCGSGYLLVGVDESRDGRNTATKIEGVEGAADLKRAIEDVLKDGISPPISRREVSLIPIDSNRSVVVVQVSGRLEYPVEVIGSAGPDRFVVREAGKKRWLSSDDALVRRRFVDVRGARRALMIVSAVALLLLAGMSAYVYRRIHEQENRIVAGVAQLTLEIPSGPSAGTNSSTGDEYYVAFVKGGSAVLVLRSTHEFGQGSDKTSLFTINVSFDLSSANAFVGGQLQDVADADLVRIEVAGYSGSIKGGKLTVVLNNVHRVDLDIPPQLFSKDGILVVPLQRSSLAPLLE